MAKIICVARLLWPERARSTAPPRNFSSIFDNAFLDHGDRDFGYAVFAKVTDGMDVVDKIAAVPTGNKGGHQDVPEEAVTITEVRVDG